MTKKDHPPPGVGPGCRSNLHGTKVHGARVRAPVGFEYKKGLVYDLSMRIGHTKFNFTLLEPYWHIKDSFGKIENCPEKCSAHELVRR